MGSWLLPNKNTLVAARRRASRATGADTPVHFPPPPCFHNEEALIAPPTPWKGRGRNMVQCAMESVYWWVLIIFCVCVFVVLARVIFVFLSTGGSALDSTQATTSVVLCLQPPPPCSSQRPLASAAAQRYEAHEHGRSPLTGTAEPLLMVMIRSSATSSIPIHRCDFSPSLFVIPIDSRVFFLISLPRPFHLLHTLRLLGKSLFYWMYFERFHMRLCPAVNHEYLWSFLSLCLQPELCLATRSVIIFWKEGKHCTLFFFSS